MVSIKTMIIIFAIGVAIAAIGVERSIDTVKKAKEGAAKLKEDFDNDLPTNRRTEDIKNKADRVL